MSPLHGLSRPARARAAFCLLLLAGAACAPDTEPANGAARGGVGDADRASAGGASPGGDAAEAGARLAAVRRRFPAALPEAAAVRLTTGPGGLDVAAPTAALPGEARVRVTLPLSARGRVELDDARSDVAVTFALVAAGGEAPADAKVAVAAGTAVYAGALGGGDLLHRASAAGTEDLAYFRRRPARAELRYDVDVERVAGLHLLGDVLELVDARGIPRLRVDRPFVVGADGRRLRARLDVSGCAVDRASGPAWRRAPTAPGASHCELVVSWPGVAYPALVDPEWTTTANQMQPRQDHTATLLPNGDVLLAGGFDASGAALDSAEVFCAPENCGIGVFGQTVPGSLVVARGGHTATLVDAGHVLLVGGKSSSGAATGLQSAELYDVAAETFSVTATSPAAPRAEHTATLLGDGRVLIVGGLGQSTAEIYDPASGFVQPTIPLGALRYGHVAELEGNSGKVLVAGGIGGLGFALSSATLFDPATNTFTPSAGNMTSVRAFAAAARLEDADGSVLITGGRNEAGVTFETAEIYDPTTDEFKPQLIQMQSKRAFHTATTLLGQGRVLLTGGDDGTGARLPNTEVFDLLSPSAFTLASQMNYGRAHHAATLLASGQVLVTGGDDPALPNHYGEVLLRQNGEPCAVGTECASGVCTTKGAVCCDKPCDDNICEACFHGDGDPNNGSCLALAPGTPTTAGCQDAIEFQLVCDGNGGITPGDIHACGAYACTAGTPQNPARCRTDADGCATDADCSADGFCNAQHKCADKQDDGSTCEGDNASQCKHGHCVDGRCCDAACDGQCEACDVPGFGGTCTQVTGAPHGSRKPCDATGTKCEGTCKSNPTACDYAPVACGDSVCKDGKVTGGVCGMGPGGVWTCTEGSKACGDYTCAPDGKDCRTDCQATTTDCAPGRICTVDGQCAVVADTKCDEDHTLVNPDGTSVDCTPFKCRGTACIDRCKTVDDCVSPSVCDDQGRCTAAPAAPAAPSGCSLAPPGSGGRDDSTVPLWMVAGLFVLARRRARRALTAACAAAAATLLPGAVRAEPAPGRIGGAPPTEPEIAHAPDPAKRDEARAHFEKGLKLLQEEAWQASLAEFLRSRELYPTRAATINAGVVLRKLHRFDEALDMFESVLRDFSGLTAAEKQSAQTAVAELRQLVGTIDVTGAVPGATIVVDGKNRADYPIVEPLRVAAGTHVVRVFKVGFEPFEKRAEVAGGQTLHIDAQLVPLRASGRLRIAESSGKKLDVHVDGALVGVTPWDGVMAVGTHAVVLQGDEDWGTPPVSAKVKVGESTVLNLPATHLESQLAVTVAPAGAEIVVDAVPVGHGAWQGRLARGSHRVEARADGFFPRAESFSLDRGELKKLSLTLERDAEAAAWRKPAKAQLDAVLAFGVAPSLGGGVAGSCSGECNGAAAIGGLATLHATYRFGSGFGVGLAAGYLRMTEDLSNRAATIQATGLPASHGKADDALRVHGALVGATAGYALDLASRVPAVVRVGAGALIGSVRDARTGTFPTRAGADVKLPEASSDPSTAMLYVDPEAQVGFRVNDHLQLFADVQALFLVAVKAPRWGDDANPPLVLGADGFAKYPTDTLVGTLVVVLAPGVGARWTF